MIIGRYYHETAKLADWCHWCPVCLSLSFVRGGLFAAVRDLGEEFDYKAAVGAVVRSAHTLGYSPLEVCEFNDEQWGKMLWGACSHNALMSGIAVVVKERIRVP